MAHIVNKRFVSPYEVATPEGAEGWQELYPYFLPFREDRREAEEARFWFCDSQHWPSVFRPFDTIGVEFAIKCLGQYNTRVYLVPPANGIDYRVLNGYVYMSPVAVAPEKIGERVPLFLERAGFYFQHWNELLEQWQTKVRGVIADLEAITFSPLPSMVPGEWVTSGRGLDNTYDLINNYNRLIELCYKAWQYHFEFLNLGYVAYLDFFGFCKQTFPDIPDQAIAKMVQGIEVDLFRPDDELKKLAVKLGVADTLKRGSVDEALAAVAAHPNGSEPFTIMLYGITSERVAKWLHGEEQAGSITGMAASPGGVEGIARVIRGADELSEVQEGEILVTPVTAPSWASVFAKIKATVTDIGGMMSHAAIVCREYGLPAVTGTGSASTTIKTGQRVRVDGNSGEVTILTL